MHKNNGKKAFPSNILYNKCRYTCNRRTKILENYIIYISKERELENRIKFNGFVFLWFPMIYPKSKQPTTINHWNLLNKRSIFWILTDVEDQSKIQTTRPLNNETYSAFKRANVVKGILCPSLTNSFKNRSLERSYLTYTHRQRQKSLIIVNIVDFLLKAVLALLWFMQSYSNITPPEQVSFDCFLCCCFQLF